MNSECGRKKEEKEKNEKKEKEEKRKERKRRREGKGREKRVGGYWTRWSRMNCLKWDTRAYVVGKSVSHVPAEDTTHEVMPAKIDFPPSSHVIGPPLSPCVVCVVLCGVVWCVVCGVVWCGVVWCGVV